MLMRGCLEFFSIDIGKCICAEPSRWLNYCRHRRLSVFRCINYFSHGLLHPLFLSLWDVGKYLKASTSDWLMFRHRKMPAHMILTYFWWNRIESLFILRRRKMSEINCELISQPNPMCLVLFILLRVLLINFCR